MNKVALKIAASPIVLGLTMVGCSTGPAMMSRHMVAPSSASQPEQKAARHFELAEQEARKGDMIAALAQAEKAVELSPRDAGYRMLLADLYLKNGRFHSAETALQDVLTLNPGHARATFHLALSQIALGKKNNALMQLESISGTAAAADLGLAFALAGQPDRAVAMLEPAAREVGADARIRQNLALAYALSGDWQRARITASQDLNPSALTARMEEWARFAEPKDQQTQVASLLGITPAADPGQPMRLALAPAQPEPVAYAAYEAQPEAPVAVAAVAIPAPTIVAPAAEEAPAKEIRYAAAAKTLIEPAKAVADPAPVRLATFTPPASTTKAVVRSGGSSSRFVVQIGAYSSSAGVERAWAQAQKRFGLNGDYMPLTATVSLPGKGQVHRLSLSGFEGHGEAAEACRSIKSKGGACFVRTRNGDAPVRWASRDSRSG